MQLVISQPQSFGARNVHEEFYDLYESLLQFVKENLLSCGRLCTNLCILKTLGNVPHVR